MAGARAVRPLRCLPRTGRLRLEVRLPLGLEAPERQPKPVLGNERLAEELQAHLVRQAVLLARVAPAARRHHAVPGMLAAPGLRKDVIHVLGGIPAVLADP